MNMFGVNLPYLVNLNIIKQIYMLPFLNNEMQYRNTMSLVPLDREKKKNLFGGI